MPTLITLPRELQASVTGELDGKAVASFRLACKDYQTIAHDRFRQICFDHVTILSTDYALHALVRVTRDRENAKTIRLITCVLLRLGGLL